jgi:glycosyltransferase involved in cell wall biosynthesis
LQADSRGRKRRGGSHNIRSAGPLVSCIIIFLNEEQFLGEAIESVLAQTYSNWELLLVDDGSSDSSKTIATAYCARSPDHIRYLSHEGGTNRGMSASRNLGLRAAAGSLAAFLDGDDSWLPDKLEQQVALFKEHPEAVMVCGATLYWHSWQGRAFSDQLIFTGDIPREGRWLPALQQNRLYHGDELLKHLYPLGAGMTPSSSGNMFRRDSALGVGGYDDAFRGLFEDQVFRAKMYLAGPIYVSSECFDRYRQHDGSSTRLARASGQSRSIRLQFLRWLKQYLKDRGYRDPEVSWKLRKALLKTNYPNADRLMSKVARVLRLISPKP